MVEPLEDGDILDLPMCPNDVGAETVRDYLRALLLQLWESREDFSSKRPFGNSGWEHELYVSLVLANVVEGTIRETEHGREVECDDEDTAHELITRAIKAMGEKK